MMGPILITGGFGYVGGRLVQHFCDRKWQVIVGTRQHRRAAPDWFNGTVRLLDLSARASEICKDVAVVIHLAAVNEIESMRDPATALAVNGLGSLNLLRAAVDSGVTRFVYFSTAHVYGSPLRGAITELTLPRPVHPYAITHRVAEDFVLAAHDRRELTGLVIRLSNSFGAPMDAAVNRWTLLVNQLCRQAVTEGKLILRSAGLDRRDFVTLGDVARATEHLVSLPPEDCGNGLFNLGGEAAPTVLEMAEVIADRSERVLGKRPKIERPVPSGADATYPLRYDIAKLKGTGFRLTTNIHSEIDSTLELCRKAFAPA